jgi:hypothetical protein
MTADATIAGIMNDELRARGEYIWRIIKNRFGQVNTEINVGMDFSKMKLHDLGQLPRIVGTTGDNVNNPTAAQPPSEPNIPETSVPSAISNVVTQANKEDKEENKLNYFGFTQTENKTLNIEFD